MTAHFGAKVSLVLVVDGDGAGSAPAAPARPGAPEPPQSGGAEELEDLGNLQEEDPADLVPASGVETDHLSAVEARLLEAFPGTSEVAE